MRSSRRMPNVSFLLPILANPFHKSVSSVEIGGLSIKAAEAGERSAAKRERKSLSPSAFRHFCLRSRYISSPRPSLPIQKIFTSPYFHFCTPQHKKSPHLPPETNSSGTWTKFPSSLAQCRPELVRLGKEGLTAALLSLPRSHKERSEGARREERMTSGG